MATTNGKETRTNAKGAIQEKEREREKGCVDKPRLNRLLSWPNDGLINELRKEKEIFKFAEKSPPAVRLLA